MVAFLNHTLVNQDLSLMPHLMNYVIIIFFAGKKSLYEQSITESFIGDHIRIASNPQWKKDNDHQGKVLFAADGLKVHRKSGKV